MANDKIIKTKDKLKKYESQFPANKNDEWQKKKLTECVSLSRLSHRWI
jgi:hypothetical protein